MSILLHKSNFVKRSTKWEGHQKVPKKLSAWFMDGSLVNTMLSLIKILWLARFLGNTIHKIWPDVGWIEAYYYIAVTKVLYNY